MAGAIKRAGGEIEKSGEVKSGKKGGIDYEICAFNRGGRAYLIVRATYGKDREVISRGKGYIYYRKVRDKITTKVKFGLSDEGMTVMHWGGDGEVSSIKPGDIDDILEHVRIAAGACHWELPVPRRILNTPEKKKRWALPW